MTTFDCVDSAAAMPDPVALSFPAVEEALDSDDDHGLPFSQAERSRLASGQVKSTPTESGQDEQHQQQQRAAKLRPGSFPALGLREDLCDALSRAGYNFPTPVQRRSIPPILSARDVVVMARTGSGKTAAFLAPVLQRLMESAPMLAAQRPNCPRALVVAPTRELALQIYSFYKTYTKGIAHSIRAAVVVGGTPIDTQFAALAVCPELVIVTPGRCLQILAEMRVKGGLSLSASEIVVFDEADRLFEGTLAAETAALLTHVGSSQTDSMLQSDRQTILVSATMPRALVEFSRTGLRQNVHVVRLDADKSMSPTLAVSFLSARGRDEKDAALLLGLRRVLHADRTAIVFAATHRTVEYLVGLLRKLLSPCVHAVHGNMDQGARVEAVSRFRKNEAKVLIVTDVAARGIDLPLLDIVINYDMPATPKLFVHRVGRAARAGRAGMALSLVSNDEAPYMYDVFLFLGRGFRIAPAPGDAPSDCVNTQQETSDPWQNMSAALDSTFLFGSFPKAALDEEVELLRKTVENVDLDKLRQSAKNAHGLYIKTRSAASGESVNRAKDMLLSENGGRRLIPVHPWIGDMESQTEQEATKMASQVSSWRPKESAVHIPDALRERKRRRDLRMAAADEDNSHHAGADSMQGDEGVESTGGSGHDQNQSHHAVTASHTSAHNQSPLPAPQDRPLKRRARQLAMEEQRRQFFVPLQPSCSEMATAKGLKASTGGSMNEGYGAFRALQDASMDINADTNVDLLRSKHMGAGSTKYWDRVTKKFVKGGVTDRTSKRNLHVASREARARANAGQDYSLGDGVMYKKWLSKNRKNVEEMQELQREQMKAGAATGGAPQRQDLGMVGLGSNDFRKGAYGRRARIAAAATQNRLTGSGTTAPPPGHGGRYARPELKTAEEIKKERKLKKKAEMRRVARQARKAKGKKNASHRRAGSSSKGSQALPETSGRGSRVRVFVRGKR